MCDHWRPSGRRAGRRGIRSRAMPMMKGSTSRMNRQTRFLTASRALGARMADNPRMRRFKPRWLGALLGGIVLPFDPVLGLVLLAVGLARPRTKSVKTPAHL